MEPDPCLEPAPGTTPDASRLDDSSSLEDSASEGPPESAYELRYERPSPIDYARKVDDIEPVGGKIRVIAEDFEVTEIPLYSFSGRGEHCYVTVTKMNRTTLQIADYLARSLGIRPLDVGFAGFKDRRAVARQTFSLLGVAAKDVEPLEMPWMQINDITYHKNKIRTGHLKGNKFRIKIREVEPNSLERARGIVARLREHGIPNYYGPQRFGRFGDNYLVGSAMLHRDPQTIVEHLLAPRPGTESEEYRAYYGDGDFMGALDALPPGRPCEAALLHSLRKRPGNYRVAVRRIPREMKRMYFSTYQAFLFNWCLKERLAWAPNAHGELHTGDLAFIHGKGACFAVEEAELADARARAESSEVSPSGPIFGRKMSFPTGEPGALERAVLEAEKLRRQSFLSHVRGIHLDGSRRPYRVPMGDAQVEEADDGASLVLSFQLPPGSYATIPLEEVMGKGRTGYWEATEERSED